MTTYREEDLRIPNPISVIRANPSKYLGGYERATGQHLASCMMSTLIWLGALPATVTKNGRWWIVASEKDWLATEDEEAIRLAFSRIVPLPAAGRNSHRDEVLLAAFADAVFTVHRGKMLWIKGEEKVPTPDGFSYSAQGRVVAFAFEDDATSTS